MSKPITLTAHLYAKANYQGEPEYWVSASGGLSLEHFGKCIASMPVTFTPEAEVNLVAIEIEALEAEKAEELRKFQASVARINDRLSKLQAITNEVSA